MTDWKLETIAVKKAHPCWVEEIEIPALIHPAGVFAVHEPVDKKPHPWRLTHLPTALCAGAGTFEEMRRLAADLTAQSGRGLASKRKDVAQRAVERGMRRLAKRGPRLPLEAA